MVNTRSGVPRGYQAVMPYLRVRDAASAIKFYKKAFGASERYRLRMGGKVGHAELDVGGCVVMLSDEFPDMKAVGPKALKGTSVVLTLYVDDVDQAVARAVKAGAKVRRAVADQFYGDRSGQIEDPYGHVWSIQTRIEKVDPKDMQKRLNAMLRSEAKATVARRSSARTARAAKTPRGPAKRASAKRSSAPRKARKAAARKRSARATAARKTTARKTTARKTTARKAAPRKVGARKVATARKVAASKVAARKSGGRKAAARRPVARKSTARKTRRGKS